MRSIAPARRRLAVLGGVLLVHAAVLATIAFDRMAVAAPAGGAPRLLTFDVAPPAPAVVAAAPKPVQVIAPAPIVPTSPPETILVSVPPMDAAASAALVAGGCDLTPTVQRALRDNVAARAAVLGLPADARSVANAVMLWNNGWVATSASQRGRRALALIRAVALASIASAPEQCRAQDQAGPRLIGVAGPPDMTLAIGSGHWRWGDLAADDATADQQIASSGRVTPASNVFDHPTSAGRSGA